LAPGTRHALTARPYKSLLIADDELTQFDNSLGSFLRLKSCSRPPFAMKMYFHSSVRTMILKSCEPGTSTIPIRCCRGAVSAGSAVGQLSNKGTRQACSKKFCFCQP